MSITLSYIEGKVTYGKIISFFYWGKFSAPFSAPVLCTNIVFFVSFVYNLCFGVWASRTTDPVSLLAMKQSKTLFNWELIDRMFVNLVLIINWNFLWTGCPATAADQPEDRCQNVFRYGTHVDRGNCLICLGCQPVLFYIPSLDWSLRMVLLKGW